MNFDDIILSLSFQSDVLSNQMHHAPFIINNYQTHSPHLDFAHIVTYLSPLNSVLAEQT